MAPKDYARIYRTNSILTAPPGQIVLLLFDGVLASIAALKAAFARPESDMSRYQIIQKEMRKARLIIDRLKGTLNFEAGGEFAPLMHRLYDYYSRRLLEAQMKKTTEPLIEIERLLGEVRNAWAQMLLRHGGSLPPAPAAPQDEPAEEPASSR